jgi:hypothetical protein
MPYLNPVAIDSVNLSSDPGFGADSQDGKGTRTLPPISFGGKLYACLAPNFGLLSTGEWNVFESADAGLTWSIVGSGTPPQFPGGKTTYDGVSTIHCAYFDPVLMPSTVRLKSFDLATLTWSAENATGPIAFGVPVLAVGVGGLLQVVYRVDPSISSFATAVVVGGAWSAPEILDQNCSAPNHAMGEPAGVIDPADRLHVFWSGNVDPLEPVTQTFSFYQAIESDGSYGAFFQFSNVDMPSNNIGIPLIVGGGVAVFCPMILCTDPTDFLTTYNGGYVGVPVNAPVWTQIPNYGGVIEVPFYFPVAVEIGGTICVLYTIESGAFASGKLQVAETVDLINWMVTTQYDLALDPPFQAGGAQLIFDPNISADGLFVTALDPTGSQFQRFFFAGSAPVPPPAVFVSSIIDAGSLAARTMSGMTYADATGAKKDCFPLRKVKC